MRHLLFCLLAALPLAARLHAQPQQRVTIERATVFLSGAELSSTAKVSLPQGETDILFTNVAGNVNAQSLTIGATNNVVVQSATFQNNYLNPADSTLSPAALRIRDSLERYTTDREELFSRKAVVDEQIAILRNNKTVAGANTGLSVAELQKLLDLVGARMGAMLAESAALTKRIVKIDERTARLGQQLDEERRKGFQPGGQLLVKFFAPRATTSDIGMTYVVPNAGWSPSYDLRVEDIKSPVKLFYKAAVYQNSGVGWKGVKLTLSSGNPTESAEVPALAPWYLQFYSQSYVAEGRTNNMQLNRSQYGSQDIERAATRNVLDVASGAAGAYQASPTTATTLNNYTAVDAAGIRTEFDIDLPYDIPSDGQTHNVAVKTAELPATYRYVAVPKLDKDAFLQAQITKWEDLNLLPAPTNVFYEGSYVGQGYIDMRNVRDTMNLSLGRDKKIIVRRERDKLYRSDKIIGTNVREAFTYVTSVRNTKREPVTITILEQFPVSNDKDIEIEDKEATDAVMEENTGAVRWTITVQPAETKKLRLAYTVKHPKDKPLAVR